MILTSVALSKCRCKITISKHNIDGLVQERRYSSALAKEVFLCLENILFTHVHAYLSIIRYDETSYQEARGRLNIKMPSYQYRDSHVKDKTVSPTVLSLTWESPYLGSNSAMLESIIFACTKMIATLTH